MAVTLESGSPMTVPKDAGSPLVLVVDDNRDAAETLRRLLDELGVRANSAYDGRTALLLAAQLKPDIVLLDILMPRMDGFEAIAALRETRGLEKTRFIAVTASKEDGVWLQLEDAGFTSALLKPVTLDSLIKVLVNIGVSIDYLVPPNAHF